VGKPLGKWPLARPRRRLEDSIKMNYRGIGYEGVNWFGLTVIWPVSISVFLNLTRELVTYVESLFLPLEMHCKESILHSINKLILNICSVQI
jgi:hypothetical protein